MGWGAWAPKIRRQFGINHLDVASTPLELAAALANDLDGIHIPKQPAANLLQPRQRTFQACKAFRLRFGRLRRSHRPKGEEFVKLVAIDIGAPVHRPSIGAKAPRLNVAMQGGAVDMELLGRLADGNQTCHSKMVANGCKWWRTAAPVKALRFGPTRNMSASLANRDRALLCTPPREVDDVAGNKTLTTARRPASLGQARWGRAETRRKA